MTSGVYTELKYKITSILKVIYRLICKRAFITTLNVCMVYILKLQRQSTHYSQTRHLRPGSILIEEDLLPANQGLLQRSPNPHSLNSIVQVNRQRRVI